MGRDDRPITRASRNVVKAGARTDLATRIDAATTNPFNQGIANAPVGRAGRSGVDWGVLTRGDSYLGGTIDTSGEVPAQVFNPATRQWEAGTTSVREQPRIAGVRADRGETTRITSGPVARPSAQITEAIVPSGGSGRDTLATNVQELMAQEKDKSRGYMQAMRDADQQIAELNRAALAAVQAGADDIAAQYDEQIAELEKDKAEARLQLKRSMAAYESYAAQVAPAYIASVEAAVAGEAAQKDALAGRADAAVAQIESNRDATVEDVEELAELIGVGEITPDSIDDALGEFSDMFQEAARGRIGDIDRISAAGALFATAIANAEYQTDLFGNDIEKQKLEAQIQGQLDDLAEAIVKLENDKATAVARAMAAYDPIGGFEDPEEAFRFAFDSIALDQGWDFDEKEATWDWFQRALVDGIKTRAEAIAWIDEQMSGNKLQSLDDWALGKGFDISDAPDGHRRLFDKLLSDDAEESNTALGVLQRLYPKLGLSSDLLDGLFTADKADWENMLTIFDAYETHVRDWERNKYVPVKTGAQAPNNYANRNAPQYVARRTVGVPTFAKMFNAAFGYSGRDNVGGVTSSLVGTIRDPSRGARNSDHQSGGAVDLYPQSNEEFDEIVRWASSQPGVSLVIGRGRSDHDTGIYGPPGTSGRSHVHVSLLLGYWG